MKMSDRQIVLKGWGGRKSGGEVGRWGDLQQRQTVLKADKIIQTQMKNKAHFYGPPLPMMGDINSMVFIWL